MLRLKLLVATWIFISFHAQAQTPLEYYRGLEGRWRAEPQGLIELFYSVGDDRIRIQGDICESKSSGASFCDIIDQDYEPRQSGIFRDDHSFGLQPVQILEVTSTRLVKREAHPLKPNLSAITTEELLDPNTLQITSETWINGEGRPQSRRQYILRRL